MANSNYRPSKGSMGRAVKAAKMNAAYKGYKPTSPPSKAGKPTPARNNTLVGKMGGIGPAVKAVKATISRRGTGAAGGNRAPTGTLKSAYRNYQQSSRAKKR